MKEHKFSPTARVLYLRGLADGMQLGDSSKEGKLLFKMLDVLEEFAVELERLDAGQEDIREAVEGLDEAVGCIEELLFDDEDDESGDSKPNYQIVPVDEGSFIEYECPHCTNKIYYDANAFDLAENHTCPECGKSLFPSDETDGDGKPGDKK